MLIYKYAGIAAIVLEYCVISYFLFSNGKTLDFSHPISYYGTLDATKYIFSITFSLAAILFVMFGLWLKKEKILHRHFKTTLIIALISQIIMSWLPAKEPFLHYHLLTAFIVGLCMPLLIYFSTKGDIPKHLKYIYWSFILFEILMVLLYPLSISVNIPLATELIAGASFHVWVILSTFEKKIFQTR